MNKTQVVGIAVIKNENKFLLTLRYQPDMPYAHNKWQLPGGGHEFGESIEDTVTRECKEEVGLNVKIETLIPKIFDDRRDNWHGIFICYVCSALTHEVHLNDEATEYGWFTKEEVKKLDAEGKTLGETYDVIELA